MRYATNFAATTKSRPLGEGGLTRSGKTEGVSRHLPFPFTIPFVKMRLERSAERDKRKIINILSAEYAQSNAEGIPNRPTQPKGRCTVRCSGLSFPHFYLAVLIKLRLSHRYLMPEMAVTAATSQHSTMEMLITIICRTPCSVPEADRVANDIPKK